MMLFNKKEINKKVKVGGMSCEHCKLRVENALKNLNEVKSVNVDLENKIANIKLKKDISEDIIKNTIDDLGFTFEGIEE